MKTLLVSDPISAKTFLVVFEHLDVSLLEILPN